MAGSQGTEHDLSQSRETPGAAVSGKRKPRIGIFGTFDVENYGDLLFPIIAERELKKRIANVELIPFSYNEKDSASWPYDVRSLADLVTEPPSKSDLDGILIGGGHLLRFEKAIAPGYAPPTNEIPHPTGYWLTPALAGIASGVPVIWNAPSSSRTFPAWSEGLLAFTLSNSAYVALRDRASVEALRKAGFDGACRIIPDTAFALPQHFPREDLRDRTDGLLVRLGVKGRYIVIQAHAGVEGVARALLPGGHLPPEFDVVALPIGPILGDDVSHVLKFCPQARHLPEWPSPLEVAGLVAHSAGVVAQSLHLSITALAYGVPVLRPVDAKGGKYALLQGSDNVHFGSPAEPSAVAAFARAMQSESLGADSLAKSAQGELEEHWNRIAEICLQHGPPPLSSLSNRFADANRLLVRMEGLGDREQALLSSKEQLASKLAKRDAVAKELAAELEAQQVRAAAELEAQQMRAAAELAQIRQEAEREKGAAIEAARRELRKEAESRQRALEAEKAELKGSAAQTKKEAAAARSELQALKSSPSWRLTAPLREIDRVVPKMRASELGVRLRAIWRHPTNSFGRKEFRAQRLLTTDEHKLALPLAVRVRAIWRYPTNSLKRKAYRTSWLSRQSRRSSQHWITSSDSRLFNQFFSAAKSRGSEYVPFSELALTERSRIRAIAFYLPQFHPIPENDEWWGRGFTEWTNVSKAVPQFVGHYQPRLPDELGFYDLRLPEVQERQIELARHYGIHGFCFHYYWFSGRKRLLERPLNQFLGNKDLDFPFCVCWANENWTRRWDGMDREILLEQRHEPEDDLQFIEDLAPVLRDRRYIRIGGRPLLLVYRVDILPDASKTARTWRDYCRANGIGNPYLVAAQTFGTTDPGPFGFDAAVEFPPHNVAIAPVNDQLELVNPLYSGSVYDYRELAEAYSRFEWSDFRVFKTVVPSWDNEARRPGHGSTFHHSTPEEYAKWLERACDWTDRRHTLRDEKIVFVNAWNEWAEGAYLEPDRRFGYAYLQATEQVLESFRARPDSRSTSTGRHESTRRIVIVSHDAFPAGAQHLALYLATMFRSGLQHKVEVVLLDGGLLVEALERVTRVHNLCGADQKGPEARSLAGALRARGFKTAIVNTAVSGLFATTLKEAGFRVVSLIHEMPGLIRNNGLEIHAKAAADQSDVMVFANERVRDGFSQFARLEEVRTIIRPQGLYKKSVALIGTARVTARNALRSRLNVADSADVVLGVGYADRRKGIDLFVETAIKVCRSRATAIFVWVGDFDPALEPTVKGRVAEAGLVDRILLLGRVAISEIDPFYAGADVYLLTSREDPYPTVVLEALDAGLPVVAFDGVTGCTDLIAGQCGRLVPPFDTEALAIEVEVLLASPDKAHALGAQGREIVAAEFSFRSYAFGLAAVADPTLKRVSVVVPNFNHLRFLGERLRSIREQTYPIFEIIVLDDASTDGSREWLIEHLDNFLPGATLVVNETNSGSVWRQWKRGVQIAKGDLVWIAESDDLADKAFLERLVIAVEASDAAIGFSDSFQVDETGCRVGDSYAAYCDDQAVIPRFHHDFVLDGRKFLSECLSVKNTIINVSSVIWRRDALLRAMGAASNDLGSYRIAGDWRLYAEVSLTDASILYIAEPLNGHRRHSKGVTGSLDKERHLAEIVAMQEFVASRLGASDEVKCRMRKYRSRIAAQLGLVYDRLTDVL